MIGDLLSRVADASKLEIGQLQQAIQSNLVPPYIGIPLLQEKLQQRQQAAMMLSGKQPPPQEPIAARILRGAQAVTGEPPQQAMPAPPAPAQMPAAADGQGGIASIPVAPKEMAGGGIVAFADGGAADADEELPPAPAGLEALMAPEEAVFRGNPLAARRGERLRQRHADDAAPLRKLVDKPSTQGLAEFLFGSPAAQPQKEQAAAPAAPTPAKKPAEGAAQAPMGSGDIKIEYGVQPPPGVPVFGAAPAGAGAGAGAGARAPGVSVGVPNFADAISKYLESSREDQKGLQKQQQEYLEQARRMIEGDPAQQEREDERDFWLSVMRGGQAMMTGDSPFASRNIAQGLTVMQDNIDKILADKKLSKKEKTQQLLSLMGQGISFATQNVQANQQLGAQGIGMGMKGAELGLKAKQIEAMNAARAAAAQSRGARPGKIPAQVYLQLSNQYNAAKQDPNMAIQLLGRQLTQADRKALLKSSPGSKDNEAAWRKVEALLDQWYERSKLDAYNATGGSTMMMPGIDALVGGGFDE